MPECRCSKPDGLPHRLLKRTQPLNFQRLSSRWKDFKTCPKNQYQFTNQELFRRIVPILMKPSLLPTGVLNVRNFSEHSSDLDR